MSQLSQTQQQILKHHGGDGDKARAQITATFDKRHDEDFWQCWQERVAVAYQLGEGIVDMGAGIGQFVQAVAMRYPEAKVYGLEAAPYMLEKALPLPPNAQLILDDLHDPKAPIEQGSVAMIMANMVVHELTQPIKMFKAAYEWLKPGGRMCVVDIVRQPLRDYLAYRYPEVSPYDEATTVADLEDAFEHFLEHNRYHADDIVSMLEMAGFKLVPSSPEKVGRFVRIVVEKPSREG